MSILQYVHTQAVYLGCTSFIREQYHYNTDLVVVSILQYAQLTPECLPHSILFPSPLSRASYSISYAESISEQLHTPLLGMIDCSSPAIGHLKCVKRSHVFGRQLPHSEVGSDASYRPVSIYALDHSTRQSRGTYRLFGFSQEEQALFARPSFVRAGRRPYRSSSRGLLQ